MAVYQDIDLSSRIQGTQFCLKSGTDYLPRSPLHQFGFRRHMIWAADDHARKFQSRGDVPNWEHKTIASNWRESFWWRALQNSRFPSLLISLASPSSRGTSLASETARKSARVDFAIAGNSREESATARETPRFLARFPTSLTINDKDRPKINDDSPVTKFDSSEQTDHERPDDSGNAKDLLNDLSCKFESNEK